MDVKSLKLKLRLVFKLVFMFGQTVIYIYIYIYIYIILYTHTYTHRMLWVNCCLNYTKMKITLASHFIRYIYQNYMKIS